MMSDNYFDISVNLSIIHVDLSEHYVDLSNKQ